MKNQKSAFRANRPLQQRRKELVNYTHREGTLWYKITKNEGLTEVFNNKKRLSSDFDIDLTELIKGDKRKEAMYKEYQLFN